MEFFLDTWSIVAKLLEAVPECTAIILLIRELAMSIICSMKSSRLSVRSLHVTNHDAISARPVQCCRLSHRYLYHRAARRDGRPSIRYASNIALAGAKVCPSARPGPIRVDKNWGQIGLRITSDISRRMYSLTEPVVLQDEIILCTSERHWILSWLPQ